MDLISRMGLVIQYVALSVVCWKRTTLFRMQLLRQAPVLSITMRPSSLSIFLSLSLNFIPLKVLIASVLFIPILVCFFLSRTFLYHHFLLLLFLSPQQLTFAYMILLNLKSWDSMLIARSNCWRYKVA